MVEYIDKDNALLQLTGSNLPKDRDSYIALVEKRLQDIPAADVAPIIHAEWSHQHDDYFDWWECTNCGYGEEGEMQFTEGVDVRTNYCPHCGAKMEVDYEDS